MRFYSARNDSAPHESGSALVAAVGVMAVMMIASVVILSATISALSFSTTTRAGVQSVAAAESGANVVKADLLQDVCAASYSRTTAPAFTVQVSYSVSATNDVWNAGCPSSGVSAQRLRITSTGAASAPGVNAATADDVTIVESIYELETIPGVMPSGAAMYMHGGVTFANNNELLVSEGGAAAVQVKDGNVTCSNNTVIQGDVIVESGDLNILDCTISGNAWVSGHTTLGQITGNLSSGSVNNSSLVGGVYLEGGEIPTVPAWVDLDYVPGDWVEENGTPYKVTPIGADCTITPGLLSTAYNGGKPIIINALGTTCPGGVTATGTVQFASDTVVFAHAFDFFYGVNWHSTNTDQRKVWFITPDTTANRMPDCAGQGNFEMRNNFMIDLDHVSAMVYTPCQFDAKNNFEWRGQIYANGANDFKNNTKFIFDAHGVPNIDLGTGEEMVGGAIGSTAVLGDLLSVRDVAE